MAWDTKLEQPIMSVCEKCYRPTLFADWAYDARHKRVLWVCLGCKHELGDSTRMTNVDVQFELSKIRGMRDLHNYYDGEYGGRH